MSEEEINEAIEYNLEYMEAIQSEELFGGDYTSQAKLNYADKRIEQLQQRIEKAIEYIENETYEYDLTIKLQYFKDTYIGRYLLQILKGDSDE